MGKRNRRQTQKPRSYAVVQSSNSLVDIILLVYKEFTYLEQVLDALPKAAGDVSYTAWILSNGNTREEYEQYIKPLQNREHCKVLYRSDNIGFPRGCNYLASKGTAPYVYMLNSDVILHENAIKLLVDELKTPDVGIAGSKLIFPTDGVLPNRPSGKIQHAGLEVNSQGRVVHTFIGWDPDNPKVNVKHDCFAVTGASLMISRELWVSLGGFFEGYGRGTMEDVDLCLSAHKKGLAVMYVPESSGDHYTGSSAIKAGVAFPLELNYGIFGMRHPEGIPWTEWMRW